MKLNLSNMNEIEKLLKQKVLTEMIVAELINQNLTETKLALLITDLIKSITA